MAVEFGRHTHAQKQQANQAGRPAKKKMAPRTLPPEAGGIEAASAAASTHSSSSRERACIFSQGKGKQKERGVIEGRGRAACCASQHFQQMNDTQARL